MSDPTPTQQLCAVASLLTEIEVRTVKRYFVRGKGYATYKAALRGLAKSEIIQEIREEAEEDTPGQTYADIFQRRFFEESRCNGCGGSGWAGGYRCSCGDGFAEGSYAFQPHLWNDVINYKIKVLRGELTDEQ